VSPRSYLFVPATRPERIAKALASGADAIIIDLEDAVPPAGKATARAALTDWFDAYDPAAAAPAAPAAPRAASSTSPASTNPTGATSASTSLVAPGAGHADLASQASPAAGQGPIVPIYVRVNAADTPWFADDLAACRAAGRKLAGIVLPKAERIEQLARATAVAPVLPLIESAQGFAHLHKLAYAPRVERLLFGSIDFRLDLGIEDEREGLLYFRSELALQSRLADLPPPVDGVTTDFEDAAAVADDTRYARRLGFGAKLCIHPKQLEAVHKVFSPTEQEIAWAQRVLQAAEAAQGAAVALDGKMIDRPVILAAQRIIDSSHR